MVPLFRLCRTIGIASVWLFLSPTLFGDSYSGTVTVFYGAQTVGSGMFNFDTEGNQVTFSLSGDVMVGNESYSFSESGSTTFSKSGLSLISAAVPSEDIPSIRISPKATGSLVYRGTVTVDGVSLVLEVEFSSVDDPDMDGVLSLVDSTPYGVPPTIGAASLAAAVEGRFYRASIPVTGSAPIMVTTDGLPMGLMIATNGVISGRATETGLFSFTITAENGATMQGNLPPVTRTNSVRVNAATTEPMEATGTIEGGEDPGGQIAVKLWFGPNDRVADISVSLAGALYEGVTPYSNTTNSLSLTAYTAFSSADMPGGPGGPQSPPPSVSVPAMTLRRTTNDPGNLIGTVRVGTNNYTVAIPLEGDQDEDGIFDLLDATPKGVPPVITSTNRANGLVGQAFSYTITTSGSPVPEQFGAAPLPEGLTLSGNTISGTPTLAGTNRVNLSATNRFGAVGTNSLSLTIFPAFESTNAVQGLVNSPLAHMIVVSSNNFGSALRFTASGLPTGTTISVAGVISGRPTVAGVFPAVITATVSGASVTQNVTFTIRGAVGGAFSLGFSTNATNALNLPAGMTFNRATRSASGTPLEWGTFEVTEVRQGGETQPVSLTVFPSAPVIVSPTNLAVQVGQEARYQIVPGGPGREWAGYDGFSGPTLSTNWTTSFRGSNLYTNAKASLQLVDGVLSFASARTNEGSRAAVFWSRPVPLHANWAAFVRTRVLTPTNETYALQGEVLALAMSLSNVPYINAKLIDFSGGGRRVEGNHTGSDGDSVTDGGNPITEGLEGQDVWVGLLHAKKTNPTSLTSLGALLDSTNYTELRTIDPRELWGLRRTNALTLAISGMSDYAVVPRGTITHDDFTLLPDPEDIEYNAYLIATNGIPLTNEGGDPYLPEGIVCDPVTGTISGSVDTNTVGGIYRMRVEALYKPESLPTQEGLEPPVIRGSNNVTVVVLPAFTNTNSVTGYVNDANLRLQVGVSTNTFGNTLRFSASNLPTGMSINATNGLISGRPTVAGSYASRVVLTAGGASASQTVNFTIRGAAGGQFTIPLSPAPTNVTGLPAGLTYNRTTGVISGIPLAWGEFTAVGQLAGGGTTNIPISILPSVPTVIHSTNLVARVGVATNWQMMAGGFGREWAGWDDFNAPTLSTNWSASLRFRNVTYSLFTNSEASMQLVNGELSFASSKTNDGARAAVVWARPPPLFASWYAIAKVHVDNPGFTNGSLQGEMLAIATNLAQSPYLNSKLIRGDSVRFEGNYYLTNGTPNYDGPDYTDGVDEDGYLAITWDPRGESPALTSYGMNLSDENPTQLQQINPRSLWNLALTNRLTLVLSGMSDKYISPRGTIRLDDFRLLPDPEFIRYSAAITNGDPLPEGVTVDLTHGDIFWSETTDVPGGFYDVRLAAEYTLDGTNSYDPPIRGIKDIRVTVFPSLSADEEINLVTNVVVAATNLLTVGTNTFGSALRYRAEGLPDGLVFNTNSGVLSGRPTVSGLWLARLGVAVSNQTSFVPVTFLVAPSTNGFVFNVGTPVNSRISLGAGLSNYTSTNLPPGLSLNRANGQITGTPLAPGTNNFTVAASGPGGSVVSTNFEVSILPSAPVIVGPTNALAKVGEVFFHPIVPGGFGREWAGSDTFESTSSTNWSVATNQLNAAWIRPGGATGRLVFRPGTTNANEQRSYLYWNRVVPAHASWLAFVDGTLSTNRTLAESQYGKADLVAVQVEGRNFTPAATIPTIENIVHSKLRRESSTNFQIGEINVARTPWQDSFGGANLSSYLTFRSGLSLSNSRVVYRSAADNFATILPPVSLSVNRSWWISLDVQLSTNWSSPYADLFLGVMRAPEARDPKRVNPSAAQLTSVASNRVMVSLWRTNGPTNYFGQYLAAANGVSEEMEGIPTSLTQARLALGYNATNRSLQGFYSTDGGENWNELRTEDLNWETPGSLGGLWGLNSNSCFWFFAGAGAEGAAGNNNNGSRMWFDNLEIYAEPGEASVEIGDWSVCAVGYDSAAREITTFGWDPSLREGAGDLVELNKTTTADWRIGTNTSFVVLLGGHHQWPGMTTNDVSFDNFVLMPWKEEFTYEVVGDLPAGVGLDSEGYLVGAPETGSAGTYNVTLRVTGSGGTATRNLRIVVGN